MRKISLLCIAYKNFTFNAVTDYNVKTLKVSVVIIPVLKPVPFIENALRCPSKTSLKATVEQLHMAFVGTHSWTTVQSKPYREPPSRLQKRQCIFLVSCRIQKLTQIISGKRSCLMLSNALKQPAVLGVLSSMTPLKSTPNFVALSRERALLYDHSTGSYVQGKCFVFLYFAINDKIRFPIGWKIYVPNQKTKYTLALELIDEALSQGFQCSYVLVDSWFAIAPFLDALIEEGSSYVCELKMQQ